MGGHADLLPLEVLDRLDVRLDPRLDAQATRVDAASDLDVCTLLDRLEQIHDERVIGVECAQAESLTQAFLLLLERLTPDERAAFLLRTVFDDEYTEIASGPLKEGDEVVIDATGGPQRSGAANNPMRGRGPRFF